ncbi:antitermination protein Q [Serratia fonticola]|uniref:Antitermination protein Q n=1 Tax=Serratia fonticola TaxID=47917 RepID=A0A542BN28_SERFO|nr:antitermination protein Q [Serratia fonticola]TQI97985.1 antitermination protein Q [Serratia fonticola]TVZ72480.1 antitermination protein Q [Serratia fonticola]
MNVSELNLKKEQRDWLNGWLELWGAWVYSGRLDKRQGNIIAKFMATVESQSDSARPMCSDDDGLLISLVVDSVLGIDTKAIGILLSYYAYGASKRSIAAYYHKAAKPRRMTGRLGEGWRKPSLSTCRNEIDQILNASLFILYQPLQNAFICRKRVAKISHIGDKVA